MCRSLVLTNEAARHPFRAQFAPPVRRRRTRVPSLLGDVRDFLLTFCGFFLAALVFIA
jgi:hypothetical protein